jgi:hypothetical protein
MIKFRKNNSLLLLLKVPQYKLSNIDSYRHINIDQNRRPDITVMCRTLLQHIFLLLLLLLLLWQSSNKY